MSEKLKNFHSTLNDDYLITCMIFQYHVWFAKTYIYSGVFKKKKKTYGLWDQILSKGEGVYF